MNQRNSGLAWGARRRTGAPRRPRFTRLSFGARPRLVSLRHLPDPTCLDWTPGQRPDDIIDHLDHRPPDAARRPSCTLTEPTRSREVAPNARRSRFLRHPPSQSRYPSGVELAVLLNRLVGTERFLRRCPSGSRRAGIAFANCEGGLISQSCLVPLGEPECDAVA